MIHKHVTIKKKTYKILVTFCNTWPMSKNNQPKRERATLNSKDPMNIPIGHFEFQVLVTKIINSSKKL